VGLNFSLLCKVPSAGKAVEAREPVACVRGGTAEFADLVAYRIDPTAWAVDQLWDLQPAFTMIGGRAAFRP
jgi:hypothetical protein